MYKQLIEDASEESAIMAASEWRSRGNSPEAMSAEKIIAERIGGNLMKSRDIKDLVAICIKSNYLMKTLGVGNEVDATMQDMVTGMILGFKYAMYLHEQRELQSIK